MSQQQKVTKSKYLKDLGHAAVDQSNADGIINAATTQGIYNLMLGLSNAAGPSVGSMLTQLDLIKVKLEGDEAGVDPDFSKIDAQLIDFLIEEAGENIDECIAYIDNVMRKLNKFKEGKDTEADAVPPNVGEGHTNKDALASDEGGGTTSASKTQGPLPRASEMSLTDEIATETTRKMAAKDKEGAQSMTMAQGG